MRETPERVHGTVSGYRYWNCRCELCRRAHADYSRGTRARAAAKGIRESLHGTVTGYRYWRCRCARCKRAVADQMDMDRTKARRKGIPDMVHGTASGYVYWGCRCHICTGARSEYDRQRRARKRLAAQGMISEAPPGKV
jgi:hypothetical protein